MEKILNINVLRHEPLNQVFAARFTDTEAAEIRKFCGHENIKYSDIIRFAMRELIPNIKTN